MHDPDFDDDDDFDDDEDYECGIYAGGLCGLAGTEECDECPFNPINEAEARRREESRLALGQVLSDALAERNKS